MRSGHLLRSGVAGTEGICDSNFFLRFNSFLERGKQGEREGEKHHCVVASGAPPPEDLAHNPGMCPDWELNRRPFGSQAGAQSTELHQPGLHCNFDAGCRSALPESHTWFPQPDQVSPWVLSQSDR